ncbi:MULTISPECIES: hypothetical protein [Gilvimarinus]|uniref:hypothetical protein n=1 Tax=Gilvimarinus TaxID=940550 RepID=UPI00058C8BEB|nr:MULTISPECIES: hypothetical protein [Gilvimarinus]UTF61263.1 hypothetical protein NHM04_05545 [Gilvimarinus sp. DA14]
MQNTFLNYQSFKQWMRLGVMVAFTLLLPSLSFADAPSLPGLEMDGVNTDSGNPLDVLLNIFKYVAAVVIWIAVAYLGVKVLLEALKDIRDAKDGDTKWVSAGKSIAGGVMFFLVALAIAIWITNQFFS